MINIYQEGYGIDDFKNGCVILINKERTWTSFDVVKKIKALVHRQFKDRKLKIGHGGTLDPLADGLLVIATGKATRQLFQFQEDNKEYIATLHLGATSPSYDLETEIDQEFDASSVTLNQIKAIINQFIGEQWQTPPVYSAKRLGGKRAYEFARKGQEVKLDPVQINIQNIEILNFELPELKLKVNCSKGTYIRSLANDIGNALQCGAYLKALRRTASGSFSLDQALSVEEFEKRILN